MPTSTTIPGGGGTSEEIACVEKPMSADDVDEAAYLSANPDVAKSGMRAREHFLPSGAREGRLQCVNVDRIAEMRERKIQALKFRRDPTGPRCHGQPANFLSAATIAEFDIPEAPPVSSNHYADVPFIREIRENPQRICLDVGAGLRHTCSANVINLDIYASISTDVLCVGEDLPFESDQFDYVICGSVLEHTRRPWDVAAEICRVLKPGGKLLVDYPFLVSVHGFPHHYFNATPQGAISLFEDACDIISSTVGLNNHPIHSVWWFLAIWRYGLGDADKAVFGKLTIDEILATPPEQQIERGYCRNLGHETQRIIAAGSTVIARKKAVLDTANIAMSREAEAATRVETLESEMAALRASHSWRLTAPLRALRQALRRNP